MVDASGDAPVDLETLTLNRSEIARYLRVSLPTVDKMVADGCPYDRAEGGRGEYRFRPLEVKAWREERAARAAAEQEARDRIIQAELDLGGGEDERFDGVTADERAKLIRAEYEAVKLGQMRAELVKRDEIERILRGLFRTVSDQLQALPDALERTLNLSAADAELVADRVDAIQGEMYRAGVEYLQGELDEATESDRDAA